MDGWIQRIEGFGKGAMRFKADGMVCLSFFEKVRYGEPRKEEIEHWFLNNYIMSRCVHVHVLIFPSVIRKTAHESYDILFFAICLVRIYQYASVIRFYEPGIILLYGKPYTESIYFRYYHSS